MSFKDREKALEDKYKHDEELRFKIDARRNKLLGVWAAELMGLSGAEVEVYAKEVVLSDFEEAGDHDVLRKVMADLQSAEVDISEHRVRKKMDELLDLAKQQVMAE